MQISFKKEEEFQFIFVSLIFNNNNNNIVCYFSFTADADDALIYGIIIVD